MTGNFLSSLSSRVSCFAALLTLLTQFADAAGLVSGHYKFRVPYSPVCLNGTYPIAIDNLTGKCFFTIHSDAMGQLSGTANLRGATGPVTGSVTTQSDVVSLQAQTSIQDPTQTQAQLQNGQFVGTCQSSHGSVPCTLDASTAAPLIVTFDLDLTVDGQGGVTGIGTADACTIQVPVNVTGTTTQATCALHLVGTNLSQFTFDVSGLPTAFGFVASWSANGFGVTRTGASLPVFAPNAPPLSAHVVSRKRHGATSVRDYGFVPGSSAVESRPGTEHELVVRFAKNVTVSSATVTPSSIRLSYYVTGNEITIELGGVADMVRVTVTLAVSDGTNSGNVTIPIGFLLGDTTGNGSVNASDISQTKAGSGQALDYTNFRSDVNLNGSINASDISLVKSKSGSALP